MLIYVYGKARWFKIGKQDFSRYLSSWKEDDIRCALLTKKYKFNSNDISYTKLKKFEVKGPGYETGGKSLANKCIIDTFILNDKKEHKFFHADNLKWEGCTFYSRWGILYNKSFKNQLIACVDYLQDLSVYNGYFSIHWHNTGIIDASINHGKVKTFKLCQ